MYANQEEPVGARAEPLDERANPLDLCRKCQHGFSGQLADRTCRNILVVAAHARNQEFLVGADPEGGAKIIPLPDVGAE